MASLNDHNWEELLKQLPAGWEAQAKELGGVRRLRGCSSVSNLLRTLLLHVGHGCSLRTTSVTAKASGWASMSDVALLKRLRASKEWLHALCKGLLEEARLSLPASAGAGAGAGAGESTTPGGLHMRLIDGTLVKEAGPTGSQWRLHYSLSAPGWQCEDFHLSATRGKGSGETFKHYSVKPGDCLIADRGYSRLNGLGHVVRAGGHVILRLKEQRTPLEEACGKPFALLEWLRRAIREPGQTGSIKVWAHVGQAEGQAEGQADERIAVRLCAVRKSPEAQALAQRKLRRRAQRNSTTQTPKTLEHGAWVVVLTTLAEETLGTQEVLEWYRVRWQVELAFKRLKSLADAGHLPKRDKDSSSAWIYGKLLIALLAEKMQRYAAAFSPWGARWMDQDPPPEPLEGV